MGRLWAADETDCTDEKEICSSEYSDPSKRPQLIITQHAGVLFQYTYDAQGRPETVTYANGVVETNQYDPNRDWITRRDYNRNGQSMYFFENTSYDQAGNLLQQQYAHNGGSVETATYGYDGLNRLTSFDYTGIHGNRSRSYSYDDNGNFDIFAGQQFTYNSQNNQLINDGTSQFSYDATGRAVTVGSDNIEYDVFSNMTGYNDDTYTYDADNQRIKKVEDNDTTYYIRDGLNTLAEYDGSGNHLADYVYGISGMAAKVDLATGYFWYYKDHLGSTRQLGSSNLFRDYYPYERLEKHYWEVINLKNKNQN
jgi:hypothetical protein